MWTTAACSACNLASEHDAPFTVEARRDTPPVIGPKPNPERQSRSRPDRKCLARLAPFGKQRRCGDRTGATRQGLGFDAALVGPNIPAAVDPTGHEIDVGPSCKSWIVAKRTPPALYVDRCDVIAQHHHVRHSDHGKADTGLARVPLELCLRDKVSHWLKVDLRSVRGEPSLREAGTGSEPEVLPFSYDSELGGQPYAAQRGVSAEQSDRSVAIEVSDREALGGVAWRLDEHNAVGADAGATRADSPDGLGLLEAAGWFRSRVDEHEVVAGTGELVKTPSIASHHTFPVTDHQRSRHTIQTASRTMRLDILLSPSVRSTNTIGISAIRNPFFHALKLISI